MGKRRPHGADVAAHRIIVQRDPVNGLYQSVAVYDDQESVRPPAAPNYEFRVAAAFPE
jgi:hypothetical protein